MARIAARQHRAVGHDQMVGLGFGRGAIARRLRAGRIWRVHRGVYAVGPGPLDQLGCWFAALLACRPSPALSHLSAAAESGIAREVGGVHVTVPRHNPPALKAVTVHCVRRIDPLDPGRRGLKPLRRLIDDYLPTGTANEGLERLFQRFLEEEGFPQPLTNVVVCGLIVDCYWPAYDFVVELDSREFHSHWRQQERDRARDGTLLRAGIGCLRVTERRLTRERDELRADLASALSQAGSRRGLR